MNNLNGETKNVFDLSVLLSSSPRGVKTSSQGGGYSYVPISVIESELDSMFGPLGWQRSMPEFKDIAVETWIEEYEYNGKPKTIMKARVLRECSIVLKVKNPATGEWIERGGASSDAFTEKQSGTFSAKLLAEAFKNASKSLGAKFGRELNRKDVHISDAIKRDKSQVFNQITETVAGFTTANEVWSFEKRSSYRSEQWFRKLITQRIKELKK